MLSGLGTFAGVSMLALIFGVILAIAWIVLPFALIGTKPILRDLLAETRKTNALLETIRSERARVASTADATGS